jgi:predicted XRE-type DNA-binding protein
MQTLFDEIDKASELPEIREHPELVGYGASKDGQIWTRKKIGPPYGLTTHWRKVKCHPNRHGHLVFTRKIRKENRVLNVFAHHMVLECFVGFAPKGMVCRHFPDRNPANNRLENLQWGTRKENQADRKVHGTDDRGEKSFNAKLTEEKAMQILQLSRDGLPQSRIAKIVNISQQQVSNVVSGKCWKHLSREEAA